MNKITLTRILGTVAALSFISTSIMANPSKTLPEEFKVYYKSDMGYSTKPFKGSTEATVLTNNESQDAPYCYLSCFSKNSKEAAYKYDNNSFVMGQIKIKGEYHNGLCIPKGFEDKDLRVSKEISQQCEYAFPERCEKQSCWASGHTNNWY